MSKRKVYFGAILSTLLFTGVANADGTTGDIETDMMSGHSADHKDPGLMHSSPAQAPDIAHSNREDESDMLHQVNVDKKKLSTSLGSPPDQHHANSDNSPDVVHEVRDH